jgi:GNAT superfamily N-acetyltransferase
MAEEITNEAIVEESSLQEPTAPEPQVEAEAPIPAPVKDNRGNELRGIYEILDSDEVYSKYVPRSYEQFVSTLSKDVNFAKGIHEMIASDEVYSKYLPATFEETVKHFGLGKPSAAPSASVGGGSAMKERGAALPSTPQPKAPSEVEQTMMGYGLGGAKEEPTYLTPEQLESGEKQKATIASENITNVEKRQQIDELDKQVKAAKYQDQFDAMEQAARDFEYEQAGKEQGTVARIANSYARGSASLMANLYRSPAFTLDMLYIPQNYIADKFDIPGLKASSEDLLGPMYDETNPFSVGSSADALEKYVDRSQKKFQSKYKEGLTDAISNGNYSDAFGILANQIAESAPVTISLMMGNAAGLSQSGTTMAGGLVFGAGKKKELDESNPNMTEQQKLTSAFLHGITEGFFEQYGISKLGSITKNILQKNGVEFAKKFAVDGFKKTYGKAFKQYLGVSSEEALGEAATRFAQNVIDKYSGAKPDLDLKEGLADAFVSGFGQSSVYSAVPGAIYVAKTVAGKKKQQEIQQKREEITNIAMSEDIPDASKRAFGEKIKQLNEEEANVVESDNELYNSLSEDSKSKLNTLSNDAAQLEATLQNTELPDEARAILEEKLNSVNGDIAAVESTPVERPIKTLDEELSIGDTVDLTPSAQPTTEAAPQAEAATEEDTGDVKFTVSGKRHIKNLRDGLVRSIEYWKEEIKKNKPKTIFGKLEDKLNRAIQPKLSSLADEKNLKEAENDLTAFDANPLEYNKKKIAEDPDDKYSKESKEFLESERITSDNIWEYYGDPLERDKKRAEKELKNDAEGSYFHDRAAQLLDKINNDPIGYLETELEYYSQKSPDKTWSKEEIDAIINDLNTKIKLLEQPTPKAEATQPLAESRPIPENIEDTPGYAESMAGKPAAEVAPVAEAANGEAPKIILSGAHGGFKSVSDDAFDLRAKDGIREEINANNSFAKIFEYNGKKYVAVGLVLSSDSQRGNPNGRNNYSFAVAEYNDSTPSNIAETLENSARNNFKTIYPDFKESDTIDPISSISPELSRIAERQSTASQQAPVAEEAKADIERKKSLSQELIGFVWDRLAKNGITNADSVIGTRNTIDGVDFNKFWSNVTKEDLQNLKKSYEDQKQEQLDLYNKFKGAFDPSTGTITSSDTSFFDNKIKNVDAELDALNKPTTEAQAPVAEEAKGMAEEPSSDKNYAIAQEVNSNVAKTNPSASVLIQPKGNDLVLTAVYVSKDERNKGIGTKVLDSVKAEADRTGKKVVLDATNELDQETDLKRLGEFYERNGFTKVGDNKFEYNPSEATSEQAPEAFPAQEGATAAEEKQFRADAELEQIYLDLNKAVTAGVDPNTLDLLKRNPTAVMVEKALREMVKKGKIKIKCK